MYKPKSKVPASISIWDIAGLVKGASTGAGLGNAFLANIQSVDGIYHVVRAFKNAEVIHEEGDVDPIRDMEIITGELIAKDIQHCDKIIEKLMPDIQRKNLKIAKDEKAIIDKVKEGLEAGKVVRDGDWSGKEIEILNKHSFMTAKPVVYLVNIGKNEYIKKANKWLPKIAEWIKNNGGGPMLPYSAEFESEVVDQAQSTDKEVRAKVAGELGAPSMINRIIGCGYKTLRLIHYFTAGADEVKCWTIRDGTKAPGAAGVIHTDFERGFICAEVMKYTDLVEQGSEADVKAAGLYRQ